MKNYHLNSAREAIEKLAAEIDRLEATAAGVSGTIMAVQPCRSVNNIRDPERYDEYSPYSSSRNDAESKCARAMADADARLAQAREIHAHNKPALANNIALRQSITRLMENAGMPKTYSTYEYVGRARNRKHVTHQAGWHQDLLRAVPVDDGIDAEEAAYKDYVRRVDAFRKTEKEKADKAAKVAEAEQRQKISLQNLAVQIVKHALPADAQWQDVLDHLLTKNKYLRLAHYLAMNRGDWSDGSSYAEIGLSGFVPEDDRDREIVGCIEANIGANWDGDGRCFRDCKWSYDVLFGLVQDEALLADYRVAYENAGAL